MNHKSMSIIIAAALLFITAGCAQKGPTRIQPGGPTAVTTMGVDLADFRNAASEMVQQMLVRPVIADFVKAHNRKPLISVGEIRNNSDVMIDLGQLAGRINEDLLNSGLVEIMAMDAGVIDAVARSAAAGSVRAPDFLLEGTIMLLSGREGRVREKSYTFQLRLNDTRTQQMVWQRTVDVSKQTTKPAVSW